MEDTELKDLINEYTNTIDIENKIKIGCMICSLLSNMGDQELARQYGNEILEIAKEINDDNTFIRIINTLGKTYAMQGNFVLAEKYFCEALVIAEEKSQINILDAINHNLAKIEEIKQNIPKALDYAMKTVEYCKLNNDTEFLVEAYLMLVSLYRALEKFDIALEYLNKADKICKQHGDLVKILFQYAYIYRILEKPQKALEYAKRAFKTAKKAYLIHGIVESAVMIADIYFYKKQYKEAKQFAQEALVVADEKGLFDHYAWTLLVLTEICLADKDKDAAKGYMDKYKEVEHKVESEETHEKFAQLTCRNYEL